MVSKSILLFLPLEQKFLRFDSVIFRSISGHLRNCSVNGVCFVRMCISTIDSFLVVVPKHRENIYRVTYNHNDNSILSSFLTTIRAFFGF